MAVIIPDVSKQIYKEEVLSLLQSKYSSLGPLWVSFQMEWMNGIYASFKNHDKFLIVIYLLKKTLDFYSRSFVKLTYEEFYDKNTVEIEKFSIAEIAEELKIPKESARRKVNELEVLGVIKKVKKKVVIDRSSFEEIQPIVTIKKISRFLSAVSNLCENEKILSKKITSEDLELLIKNNFSYIWKLYYEMQIPMLINYKKVFKDLETFHVFGTCVVNQHLHAMGTKQFETHKDDFLKHILYKKIPGLNAMSVSDITGIPRATVIRKLKKLVIKKILTIDKKKHYKLSGNFIEDLKPEQNIVLEQLSNLSTKVFNFFNLKVR